MQDRGRWTSRGDAIRNRIARRRAIIEAQQRSREQVGMLVVRVAVGAAIGAAVLVEPAILYVVGSGMLIYVIGFVFGRGFTKGR